MFYIASKAFWFLAKPSTFLLILLVVGVGLWWSGRQRTGGWLTTIAAAALVMTLLLPVGRWLLLPLENRFPAPTPLPEQVDGIVVLSGAVEPDISAARAQPSYNQAAERVSTLIELGRRYPSARLVFTGAGWPVSAADVAREFYQRQGFDVSRIAFEDAARNTFENAKFSQRLVQPQPGEVWLLVTSARHLPRAVGVFRQAGWPVVPYPVDYRTTGGFEILSEFDLPRSLGDLDLGAKEWIGLVAYRLTGRTSTLLPAPEDPMPAG